MAIHEIYLAYAQFIRQQLEGDYFKKPEVTDRLHKAETALGEITRIFNEMPHHQSEAGNKLYQQFFGEGYHLAYQHMHEMVQITFKHILENKEAIEANLPLEHQDLFTNPEKINHFLQALTTVYSLELNAAFNRLPEKQKAKDQDDFMYFRKSLDTFTQQLNADNVFSTQWIQPSASKEEAEQQSIEYLGQIWEMKGENVLKKENLRNTLVQTVEALTQYVEKNKARLSNENVLKLTSICDRLNNCQEAIHNDYPSFAITYQEVSTIQQELKSYKQELKESRKQSFVSEMAHQISKVASPSKTISGIHAELDQALTSSRPEFLLREQSAPTTPNITQNYKDKLADMNLDANRRLSDASTISDDASLTSSEDNIPDYKAKTPGGS